MGIIAEAKDRVGSRGRCAVDQGWDGPAEMRANEAVRRHPRGHDDQLLVVGGEAAVSPSGHVARQSGHGVVHGRHGTVELLGALSEKPILTVQREAGCFVLVFSAVLRYVPCHGKQRLVRIGGASQLEESCLETVDAAQPEPHHQRIPGGEAVVDRSDRPVQLGGDVGDADAWSSGDDAGERGVEDVVVGEAGWTRHAAHSSDRHLEYLFYYDYDAVMTTTLAEALPSACFSERHTLDIAASPDRVWAALTTLQWNDLRITTPLMLLRGLGRTPQAGEQRVLYNGPVTLMRLEAQRYAAAAAIGRPWRLSPEPGPETKDLQGVLDYSVPGWLKYGMDFTLEELPTGQTRIVTTTLCEPTDGSARRRFRPYWVLIRPFSGLIRRDMLRAIARRAQSPRK